MVANGIMYGCDYIYRRDAVRTRSGRCAPRKKQPKESARWWKRPGRRPYA